MKAHDVGFTNVLLVLLVSAIDSSNTSNEDHYKCKPLEDEWCESHSECCSSYCYKEDPEWQFGVCQEKDSSWPQNGEDGIFEQGICTPYIRNGKTANGEQFNETHLIAAHRILPFNTLVSVMINESIVTVRINDRGASPNKQILKISPGAADILNIHGPELCKIKILTEEEPCIDSSDQMCHSNENCCSQNCYKKSLTEGGICVPKNKVENDEENPHNETQLIEVIESSYTPNEDYYECKDSEDEMCRSHSECCSSVCYMIQPNWHFGGCQNDNSTWLQNGEDGNFEQGICTPYIRNGKTANGEEFNETLLIAAHRILPFNTMVSVMINESIVTVRINDRGASPDKQILKISPGAADILNIHGPERCKIRILSYEEPCIDSSDQMCHSNENCCSQNCYKKSLTEGGICVPKNKVGKDEGNPHNESRTIKVNQTSIVKRKCLTNEFDSCETDDECCSGNCITELSKKYGRCVSSSGEKYLPMVYGSVFEVGMCSFRGKNETNSTSDLERTATHRRLPIGMLLRVDVSTTSVVVKINNHRMPPGNQILDMSFGAASILGLEHQKDPLYCRLTIVDTRRCSYRMAGLCMN